MSVFDKKTSTDYLKSISKSMKQSQKYEEQVSAAQEEAAYAEARAARARAAVSDAQADEIRERTNQQKLTEEKLDLQKRKMALNSFLSSFDYDIDSPEDIAQKALKMIAWLDNVDRTFKNKSRKYELLNETFDDSDKFKEGLLRKRLVEANQQLNKLGYKENKANYIAQKIEFYDNRDIQEREEIARRKKTRNDKIKKYLKSTAIVVVFMWLLGLIFTAPTTKNNHDKCVKKVLSCVDKGNLIKAENVLYAYKNSHSGIAAGYVAIINAYAKEDNLEKMYKLADFGLANMNQDWHYDEMISINSAIRSYLIPKGMYKEAKKYVYTNIQRTSKDLLDYIEKCVVDMCERGKFVDAKSFVKRESASFIGNKENSQKDVVDKFNSVIASYQ